VSKIFQATLILVTTVMWASSVQPVLAGTLSPIATSGHDADIILENDGSPAQNEEIGSRWYFEQGLFGNQAGEQGMPVSRTVSGFVSPITTNTINFEFESYGANNVLDFDGATTVGPKTLTLDFPARFSQLAIVHSGGSMGTTETAAVNYTIHFVGGGTQSGTFNSFDWSTTVHAANNAARLITNMDRANIQSGAPVFDNTGNSTRWAIFVTEVTPNTARRIVSIDFTATVPNAGSGDDVDVFGLAGELVPEPSLAALAVGVVLTPIVAQRRRRGAAFGRRDGATGAGRPTI
jgi:hypothetical protein